MMGSRILSSSFKPANDTDINLWCMKNSTGPLYRAYCPEVQNTTDEQDLCNLFKDSVVGPVRGIPGLAIGVSKGMYLGLYCINWGHMMVFNILKTSDEPAGDS